MTRTCLHCVLARVLGAESERLRARGLEVRLGAADAVFLPAPGRATYRTVRGLLRTAIGDAEGPRIRLTLVSLPGKSHVEVTAAFAVGRGTRVLSCAFPRHDPAALAAGLLGQ
ncbi:MAG: hypothetical protein E6J59_02910 [Deltaproteobacteria bacterium]|nr:MAG: hypothetical protein E6J59_02910 [Deltaproteobacteria bacterium]